MAAIKIRRIDFSPDEWLAAIAGMPPEEQGVYWLVCSLIYSSGGPIQADDQRLRALCGCHGNKLNAILARLETTGKLLRNGSEIDQKRCRKELEKAQKRSEKAAENGGKGGRPPKGINDIAKPDGSDDEKLARAGAPPPSTINHQPSEEDSEADASAGTSPAADPIKAMWDRGLQVLIDGGCAEKKARPLIGKWRREFGDAALMAAIASAEDDRATEPIAFISKCLGHSRNGSNGNGRITAATERFNRGRQATLDAVLERERARDASDRAADCG